MNFKKLIIQVEPFFGILSEKFELPNTISQALTDQFSQNSKKIYVNKKSIFDQVNIHHQIKHK
jgi:hypothetical protein